MISVIMAAYNSSKYIGSSIESILNQTFRDFELLIVDDCSTDNTLEIINLYAEQDSRIRVFKTERNSGAGISRNIAAQEAKYPWLAIMDSDDIAKPERFEKQIKAALEKTDVVAWGTYAQHIASDGRILSYIQQGAKTEEDFKKTWNAGHIPFIIHPTSLIKKSIFDRIGGYAEFLGDYPLNVAEDFELIARLGAFGPILTIPEPLLLYRIHNNSESMQKFFSQKKISRYVVARHRAKLTDNSDLSFIQFLENYESLLLTYRLLRQVRTAGQFYYRRAGLLFAEREYIQAIFNLVLAVLANPSYSMERLWKQKLLLTLRKHTVTR